MSGRLNILFGDRRAGSCCDSACDTHAKLNKMRSCLTVNVKQSEGTRKDGDFDSSYP